MVYFGGNTLAFSILKLLVKSIFVLAKDDERSDSNLRGNYYLPLIYISS